MSPSIAQLWDLIAHRHRAYLRRIEAESATGGGPVWKGGKPPRKRQINWATIAKRQRRLVILLRFVLIWSLVWTGLDVVWGSHVGAMVQLNVGAFAAVANVVIWRWRTRYLRKIDDEFQAVAALDLIDWRYGLDLSRSSKIRSGRLYPALDRLESKRIVESKWDESEPHRKHRKRLYRLTQPTRTR